MQELKPWVEKYRPCSLREISSQKQVVDVLTHTLESQNLPHLLFYGPAGTGKTSTIIAMAKELYGTEYKKRVLELNASDERGIDVVREKIKNFAKLAVSNKENLPPYKLIILDESDSMTADAQAALRRTMELYSKVTSRIIDPLASRCAKFRFQALSKSSIIDRLKYISQQESVQVSEQGLDALVDVSQGDLRQAITLLQSAKQICKSSILTETVVYEMTGTIPDNVLDRILTAWISKDMDQILSAVQHLFSFGYSGAQLLIQLQEKLVSDCSFTEIQKSKIAVKLGHVQRNMSDGADEQLQLLSLITINV